MRIFNLLLLGIWWIMPLAVGAAATIPDDKAVITYENKKGVVTFNHLLHGTVRGIECNSCHHTHEEGQPIKPCSDCHKEKKTTIEGFSVVAPKKSKAYHNKCKGCHKYTLEELHAPAGPTKCNLCHIK